jgi:uncharacterized protein YrrD
MVRPEAGHPRAAIKEPSGCAREGESAMLFEAKALLGSVLEGLDGDIGSVTDALFDDREWSVRYLVADTGSWLPSRKVLIAPYAVRSVSASLRRVGIAVTRQQIEESPVLLSHLPVSRPFEAEYCEHFRWPIYWRGSGSREDCPIKDLGSRHAIGSAPPSTAAQAPVLRNTRDVIGYHIRASDGEIGRVEDIIFDDGTWAIRYLIADSRTWWPAAMVLIAPQYIEQVSWDERTITISLTREAISTFRPGDGPAPNPDGAGNSPHRLGDHVRPDQAGEPPRMHDTDRDTSAYRTSPSAPSAAMAMIIDQARDPDHVIIPIAGSAHSHGQDDLDELIRRHQVSNPGAQHAMLFLPNASSSAMPTISDSATVPAATCGSRALFPDHDHEGGP